MESKWTGLRAIREKIQPEVTGVAAIAIRLEHKIADWERALAGDRSSEKHQELTVELNNLKEQLLHMKRRLVGRTPQMESWADPLPG